MSYKKSITYQGPKLWNSLPGDIQKMDSYHEFKTQVSKLFKDGSGPTSTRKQPKLQTKPQTKPQPKTTNKKQPSKRKPSNNKPKNKPKSGPRLEAKTKTKTKTISNFRINCITNSSLLFPLCIVTVIVTCNVWSL